MAMRNRYRVVCTTDAADADLTCGKDALQYSLDARVIILKEKAKRRRKNEKRGLQGIFLHEY